MKKLIAFLFLALSVSASPTTLTNRQIDTLLASLLRLQPGLSAANTTAAADDINELTPLDEAFAKGNQAAAKRLHIGATVKSDDPALVQFQSEVEANNNASVTAALTPLTLSDDEIVAAKITPADLAIIIRWLAPAKKK